MEESRNKDNIVRATIAFIGVGSNLGDPENNCRLATERLSFVRDIKVLRGASLYHTEPIGLIDQPWFVNTVVELRTCLSPQALLKTLKDIEAAMGRSDGPRWGPRCIDLDLLLYGQEVIRENTLMIPHPEMHKRRFVLAPLCELASFIIHPEFGVSIRGLLERLKDCSIVKKCGPPVFAPREVRVEGLEKVL